MINVNELTVTQRMAAEIMEELKKAPTKKPRVAEEVMATIYPEVQAARDSEWTWKDILELVRKKGLKISAARLKALFEEQKAKATQSTTAARTEKAK